MKDSRPRVLIEDWRPIEAIGAESKRELGVIGTFASEDANSAGGDWYVRI